MNLTIQIAGVTMTGDSHAIALDSPSHVNALNQRDTFSFRLVSKDGTYIPAIGAAVLVSDEDGDRFGGNIQQLDVQQFGGALISTIGCSSWEQLFDRRFTGQRSYVDQYAGVVFQSLLDECMSGDGITGSVVATGPRITISFDFQTVREAFDLIVAQASTLTDTFMWDCTPARVARLYMQTSFPAPFDIDDSSTEVGMQGGSVVLQKSINLNKYTNRVYPRATQLISDARPEEFTAAAGQNRFDLELSVAAAPTVTVDSVVQTVGIDGVDTGKDWYWSAGSNAITQDPAGAPLTAGQDVVITYQPQESRVLDAVQNDAEIDARATAEGTLGYFSSIYEVNAPGTADEARAAAQSWLDRFSRPPCSIEYPTLNKGVRAGQHQTINLTLAQISDTFLIESVTMSQSNELFQWRVKAVSGALAGDYKMRLREMNQSAGGNGSSGLRIVTGGVAEGYYVVPVITGHATPDLSRGVNQEVVLTDGTIIDAPVNAPGPITWTLVLAQDSTGGRAVTFGTEYVGAASLPTMLNTDPDTYTSMDFVIRADSKSALSNIITGVPLS